MAGRVHIGTSGWHYKHWLGRFYPANLPAKGMLTFYSQLFDAVELNNTFYHLPADSTFHSWRENTPKNFLFALKGSRFITHMKKLKDPQSSTAKFFHGAELLEAKLGPILFQLPPRRQLNLERLSEFLDVLPKHHRYSFEFRDPSWLVRSVYDLLRKHNAALCIYDFASNPTPLEVTADFTVRLHGPGKAKYAGSYPVETLEKWARRIKDWQKELVEVYVYFNNDIGGHAVRNANQLREMI
jgi:uncharacterized protein YecE (DUF72 family)